MSRQKNETENEEYCICDVHSHILPQMDDGSKSVEESVELLGCLAAQGIGNIVVTPHYYPSSESPQRFLDRRNEAFEQLSAKCTTGLPEVHLGAEVLYFKGISRMAELERLCTQGTSMLLLEMPDGKWNEYTLREVGELAGDARVSLALAHIERYVSEQSADVFDSLLERGVQMQVNAEFFINLRSRHRALKMLCNGKIQFLGSDCHGLQNRPPRMGEALAIIERRIGADAMKMLERNCFEYFDG